MKKFLTKVERKLGVNNTVTRKELALTAAIILVLTKLFGG